jgi:SAM-dependent methyltransferase
LGLGLIGLAYLITHPEPPLIWSIEAILVIVPAALIVYGGYWIANHPLDRSARWIVAGWALGGALIADVFVAGYVLSEQFSGGLVTESGQLVLFGAFGGSLVSLFAAISTQYRYHVPDVARSDEGGANAERIASSSRTTVRRELSDIGSRIEILGLAIAAAGVYREEGIRSVVVSARRSIVRRLVDMGLLRQRPYHERKRTDSEDRWEMIVPHLPETDETALDIGCASGFFAARLADEGLSTTGIDVDRDRIETARRIYDGKEGVEFDVRHLDPRTVSELPTVDVVLLLTVYHHWCDNFGRENAEDMLRELASNSKKILFEPPGEASHRFQFVGERPLADDESIIDYYSSLLMSIFDERVEVTYLGETEYPSDATRTDPVFLIDCREYTI